MLDFGSSISLIQESIVTPFSDKNKISPSGLQLTSASGDNILILGCITLPLCIVELQTSHSLVVVKSLITPVILGLDFLQKYRMILDFTSSSVKIDSKLDTSNFNDCSENSKSMLDVARQIRNKVCAVKTLNDTTEETINDCAVPLFSKNLLQYDIPVCNVPAVVPLLSQYKHLFKTCPGKTTVTEHFIPTTGTPVKVPPRRIPANYRSQVENQIQTMLQEGMIEECSSPWMAPAVFIQKKTGDIRICVDYRELNKKTTKEAYPLPRPDEVQDRLSGSMMFSTLDLRSGYWQLPVNPADRRKTAFCPGPGLGLFQFCRMPFGLSGAPGSFQRLMDMLFRDFSFVTTYLDDVLVHSRTVAEHKEHLRAMFDKLESAGLTLNGSKCTIGTNQVKYLGHVFSFNGMEPDPSKTSAVCNWSTPSDTSNLCSFLGLASYYRRCIHNFAEIATPLYQLTNRELHLNGYHHANRHLIISSES